MATKYLLLTTLLFSSYFSVAQSLSKKEIRSLQGCFYAAISLKDDMKNPERDSEFIECYLTIDSLGKVNGFRFLADTKNWGPIVTLVKKITVEDFKKWKSDSCKNKTILVPVISLGLGKDPDYIRDLKRMYSPNPNSFNDLKLVQETASIIILSPFVDGPITTKE